MDTHIVILKFSGIIAVYLDTMPHGIIMKVIISYLGIIRAALDINQMMIINRMAAYADIIYLAAQYTIVVCIKYHCSCHCICAGALHTVIYLAADNPCIGCPGFLGCVKSIARNSARAGGGIAVHTIFRYCGVMRLAVAGCAEPKGPAGALNSNPLAGIAGKNIIFVNLSSFCQHELAGASLPKTIGTGVNTALGVEQVARKKLLIKIGYVLERVGKAAGSRIAHIGICGKKYPAVIYCKLKGIGIRPVY